MFSASVQDYSLTDLGQGGRSVHQAFCLFEAGVSFCYHVHRLLPNKLQSIQPTAYYRFTLAGKKINVLY